MAQSANVTTTIRQDQDDPQGKILFFRPRFQFEPPQNSEIDEAINGLRDVAATEQREQNVPLLQLDYIESPALLTGPPMAPGIGGYNIPLPLPALPRLIELRAPPTAPLDLSATLLVEDDEPTTRQLRTIWLGRCSYLVSLSTIMGLMLLGLLVASPQPAEYVSNASSPPAVVATTTVESIAPAAHLIVLNQIGTSNAPLALGVRLEGGNGSERLNLSGLADGTELSLGRSLGSDGWEISAADLDQTFVGAPKDFVGIMDATIELRSVQGELLARGPLRLEWTEPSDGMPAAAQGPNPLAAATSQATAATPNDLSSSIPLAADEITTLMKLGQDLLHIGDLATARLLFKRAAIAGNADAALALAKTYDPTAIGRLDDALGLAPDINLANQWYERAAALGSTEASTHLSIFPKQ